MGTSPRKSMGKSGAGAVTHQKLCGETNPRVVQLVSSVAMWLLKRIRSPATRRVHPFPAPRVSSAWERNETPQSSSGLRRENHFNQNRCNPFHY